MATEHIDIVVTMTGDRVVNRSLRDIGQGAKTTTNSINFLKNALQIIGLGLLLREAKQYLDINTQISNRLKLVTGSTAELVAVQNRLFQISQNTRQGYAETATVYSRVAMAASTLGLSQNEILRTTDLLNKTLAISGGNTSEAAASMVQFAQAIGSGRLQGDELRSILENNQALAIQLAKGLGVSTGALKTLGAQGKLTSEQIIAALQKQGGEIDALFSRTSATIGQSLTVLNNSVIRFVGDFDKVTGTSQKVAQAILFVADHMESIGKFAVIAATSITAVLIPALLKLIKAMAFFLVSNPFALFIAGIAGAAAAFVVFRDDITRGAANALNTIADGFNAFGVGVSALFEKIGASVSIAFDEMANTIIDKIEALINAAAGALSKLPGIDPIGKVTLERRDSSAAFARLNAIPERLQNGILQTTGKDRFGIDDYLKAKEGAEQAIADLDKKGTKVLTGGGDGKGLKKAAQEWKQLLDAIDPTGAAIRDYEKGQQMLNNALATGKINLQEYTRYTTLLKANYEDAIDPLGRVTREIEEQIKASQADTRQKKVSLEFFKYENELKKQGVLLNQEQRDSLLELITTQQKLQNPTPLEAYQRELMNTGDTIEQYLVDGMRDASDSMAKFLLEGKSGLEDFGSVLKSVAQQFASFALQQAIFKPAAGWLSGMLGGGSFLSGFGFANGAAFQNGNVTAFANGGIVDSPTVFPMANGMGLMGEAGAEAVMPLRRMANGRLGVEAGNNGGTNNVFSPVINVSVPQGTTESQATRTATEVTRAVENAMADFMRRQQKPGGQLNEQGAY